MTDPSSSDQALRTICDDGIFRILIASTTDTVAGVLDAQAPDDELRPLVADLVSASVLLRLTMSPDNRLQAILQNRSAGSLVADSHPDGTTRGLVRRHGKTPFELGDSTHFSVHRTMFDGDIHQGVVETSAGQSMADAVTGYLHRSEQITSVVGLGHRFDGDELDFAGGYIIQLMPADEKADQASLALMTARLENLPDVARLFDECDGDQEQVADMLYGPISFHGLDTDDFHFGCVCSPDRVRTAINSLADSEIDELLEDDEALEVDCDYCGAVHQIEPDSLRR